MFTILFKPYNICVHARYSLLYVRLHKCVFLFSIANIAFKSNENHHAFHSIRNQAKAQFCKYFRLDLVYSSFKFRTFLFPKVSYLSVPDNGLLENSKLKIQIIIMLKRKILNKLKYKMEKKVWDKIAFYYFNIMSLRFKSSTIAFYKESF